MPVGRYTWLIRIAIKVLQLICSYFDGNGGAEEIARIIDESKNPTQSPEHEDPAR